MTARAEYACTAVMDLAEHQDSGKVAVREIAERNLFPPKFLVHILLQLKKAGLVESTRGAGGGYVLKKKPEEITLGSVLSVINPQRRQRQRLRQEDAVSLYKNVLQNVWNEAEEQRQKFLNSITIADLLRNKETP